MLHKTRGIVFRLTPYGETSAIVNIFTESFGLRGYIVNGLRSKASKNKIAIYQPLTPLELVVYHKENAKILRIKEARCIYIYRSLAGDLKKLSIALFLNEILNKAVKEKSGTAELYNFLKVSLTMLDTMTANVENFHLIFLIKLTRFLGIGTHDVQEIGNSQILTPHERVIMEKLLEADYTTAVQLTNAERQSLLKILLHFYSSHIRTMHSLKSMSVLHEVLN